MAIDLTSQIISIFIVILLFLSLLLSKKIHYFIAGLLLIFLGSAPYLYEYSIIPFNIMDFPVFNFTAYFFIVFASKDLFKEGFKEKESALKWPSLILAIVLIVLTTIPTLNKLQVIDFVLEYPPVVDHVIYIVSGLFLLIGIFTIIATKED